jgi:hypothetical protein
MSGELTDWVLLFNSKNGPHVARNIRGDITFDGHEASVCFLHPPAEKMAGAEIAEVLEGYGVEHVDLDPGQCSEINLTSHDVLIANRGEFLKQTGRYMAPLLGLIEEGTFQQLKTLPDSEIAELSRRWAAKAEEIEREVKAGIRQGYGLVKVENESTLICMTPGTQEDVLRSLISDQRKVLARFFAKPPEISIRTAEAAFSASKRGECGAIFAGHADLSETIQALQRDTIGYAIIPLWFTEKEIADRAEEIQRTKNLLVAQEAARKQQIQEAKQLDELKKQKEAEQKGSRESELRKQHEPKARALADKIAKAIKLLVDDKKTWAANNFTALANWYRERDAEGWTFVDLKYPIEDYGVADWKGRPLEVVFTDVSISMKHRLLGETRPFCFRLGIIFDAEYEMHRDPFERPCEDASDASKDWKQARKFESLWVVE